MITRAGPVLGVERARPGGGVWTLPSNSAPVMQGHAVSGIRKSQKSWWNDFGHFLDQVKGQVTRGHQKSNFADLNIFLQIGT